MPTIKIHNAETGEVIEREMNAQELAELENLKLEAQQRREIEAQQAAAKAALLEKLGITEEEAKLLLS
jgi:hypothetical protein